MKKSGKFILALIIIIFVSQNICSAKIKVKFTFGDRMAMNDCAGRGICAYINFKEVDIDFDEENLGDNMGLAFIDIVDGKMKMDVIFDNSIDRFKPDFEVAQDIIIDESLCEKLGYRSIVILAGKYNLDFANYEYGSVNLNVLTN